jgi:glycogen debranching enzyme
MSLGDFLANTPRLETDWDPLEHVYERSLIDLAALRFETTLFPGQPMPAAGLPWFMTVFGRDSLLTSFQALPFVPELAETTLRVLAKYQATEVDDFRDAEPGKILHEIRFGELTHFDERPHSPYYGTADATPLFLVLLDEVERWTGNTDLVRELEPAARAALDWIDRWGDRDGDGYVEYDRRNTETGLENQCWKDSWDSIRFADGTVAGGPIATCEIQGYVYDAKVRSARLAREVWGDDKLADRLEAEAEELKRRFNEDFWLEDRGFYALALDGEKRRVDSLTSNVGHLLWSGIVPEDRAERLAEHLVGDALFSGWGIRTMAEGEGGYNPIRYHNGTVWPHDNSLIAHGLARYGFRDEAARVALATLEAAAFFRYRLPEVFAGYRRGRTSFPVEYPTASSPQAWATGTPLLLLRVLLGLEPDGDELRSDAYLPDTIEQIELTGVPGRWGRADVSSVEEVTNVA